MAVKLNLDALPWKAQIGLVTGLCALGLGAFWYMYAIPFEETLTSRQAALKKSQTEIERGRRIAQQLPQFRKDAEALEAQLQNLRTQLPEEQDVAELLRRVQGMATESRLSIRGFTPQAVNKKELHAEWPIGLQVEGTYHDLGAFLERVSKFPRIINVGSIKIAAKENQSSGATVVADCTATTFVLVRQADEKDDAAKGKGKAKKAKPAKEA